MATPIQPKYNASSANVAPPSASVLAMGEIASNLETGKLFLKKRDGSLVEFAPNLATTSVTSVAGKTGAVTLTTSDISGFGNYTVNGGGVAAIRALTQAQYNALSSVDPNTVYIIT